MADIINLKDKQNFIDNLEQSINNAEIPENAMVDAPSEFVETKPMKVNAIYDARTGISTPLMSDGEVIDVVKDSDVEDILNTMLNGNSVSIEGLTKALQSNKDINIAGMSIDEIESLAGLINDHLNGVKINNYYTRLPSKLKEMIMSGIFSSGQVPPNQIKTFAESAAKQIINDIALDYSLSDSYTDLDVLFKELHSANEELKTGIEQIDAQMSIAFITKNLEELKKHEEIARESGDIEKADKIRTTMIEPLEESITLNKFKEFCKTARIKKFDLEKPERVFKDFNWKYINHRLNINDIHSCPGTLAKHIEADDPNAYTAVCIAFCKYCMNYKPDNPAEHAFMYYFIKNILILNIIYPNGIIIEGEENTNLSYDTIEFYNTFKNNIKECIDNLSR